jgi:hypothetical protein
MPGPASGQPLLLHLLLLQLALPTLLLSPQPMRGAANITKHVFFKYLNCTNVMTTLCKEKANLSNDMQ